MLIPPLPQHAIHATAGHDRQQPGFDRRKVVFAVAGLILIK